MALVSLWFVNAARPRDVLLAEPEADRGFARKYLAQLNASWPRTHIGDFDMVRSATPGAHEFYIGGYSGGLSVVQVIIPGLVRISELPRQFRELVSAADVFATAVLSPGSEGAPLTLPGGATVGDEPEAGQLDETYGAFAHWQGDTLKRAFSATRQTVFEDEGLPEGFESRYWEGTHETSGILLPFDPSQLAMGAAHAWLGFPVTADPDPWGTRHELIEIPVAAFAIDNRPEAKIEATAQPHGETDAADGAAYDDYASPAANVEPSSKEVAKKLASSSARIIGSSARAGTQALKQGAGKALEALRNKLR